MQESRYVLELQQEATLVAMRKALRKMLEARFGVLPSELLHQIEAIKDVNHVNQLFERAARVQSREEFSV
jgi:hypothetical protein